MPNVTDHPVRQHPPGLPEPSYVRQVIEVMAAELERTGNRRRLLTEVGLRRAFTVGVAAKLHTLPTAVANDVADRVAALLPDSSPLDTHGAYAQQLRQLAEAV